MVKTIKIGKLNLKFVLIHKFGRDRLNSILWRDYAIRIWFKPSKIVTEASIKSKWECTRSYMIGLELILFKVWFEVDYGGGHWDIGD